METNEPKNFDTMIKEISKGKRRRTLQSRNVPKNNIYIYSKTYIYKGSLITRPKNYSERQTSFECDDENDYWFLRNEVEKDIKFINANDFKIKWTYYIPIFGCFFAWGDASAYKTKMASKAFIEVFRVTSSIFNFGIYDTLVVTTMTFMFGGFYNLMDNNIALIILFCLIIASMLSLIFAAAIAPIWYCKFKIKKTIISAGNELGLETLAQEYLEHHQKKHKWKHKPKTKDDKLEVKP